MARSIFSILLISICVDMVGAEDPLTFQSKLVDIWHSDFKTMKASGCVQMTFREKKSLPGSSVDRSGLDAFFDDAARSVHRYCYSGDGVRLYFDQANDKTLVHIDNPKYFAAIEADRGHAGSLSNARLVRSHVKSLSAPEGDSIETALSGSARRVADEAKMPSASFAGNNLVTLLENGIVRIESVEPSLDPDRTEIVLSILDQDAVSTTSLRDVARMRMSLIDSLGYAPEYAESMEVTGNQTRSVKLYWRQRRDELGKTVPEMHASTWELTKGITIGVMLDDYSFDANPPLNSADFTLASFGLPEPPDPRDPGSYRTQPWLYYFFGGVLCVMAGAFFIHRVMRRSGRA